MKVEPIRHPRSRRRRAADLAVSVVMLLALVALYVVVISHGSVL